jgi:hypothetical protein
MTGNFRLLSLPAELRVLIYENVLHYDDGLLFDFYPKLVVMKEGSLNLFAPNNLKLVNRQLYVETKRMLIRVNDTFTFGTLDSAAQYAHRQMRVVTPNKHAVSDMALAMQFSSLSISDLSGGASLMTLPSLAAGDTPQHYVLHTFAIFAHMLASPRFSSIKRITISTITPQTDDLIDHITNVFLNDNFKHVESFCKDRPSIQVYINIRTPARCAYAIEEELDAVSRVMERLRGKPFPPAPKLTTDPPLGATEYSARLNEFIAGLKNMHAVLNIRALGYRRILPENLRAKFSMGNDRDGNRKRDPFCSGCAGTRRLDHFSELYPDGC